MRAVRVRFEMLVSDSVGFGHRKACVELELDHGEKACEAMRKAEAFVRKTLGVSPWCHDDRSRLDERNRMLDEVIPF